MIDEVEVSRQIIDRYFQKLKDSLEVNVAICGAGPSGLVAGTYLARQGMKVAIFEKKLSLGGGMWAGGMIFNTLIVQPFAEEILKDFQIRYENRKGLLVADAVESTARLIVGACQAGCQIFNGISVEDVVAKETQPGEKRICGFVINWGPVDALNKRGVNLEVDPLVIHADWTIDATGHGHDICRVVQEKGLRLTTPSGKAEGEGSLWVEKAEKLVVENSRQVYPGLFVCGMAANAVFGSPRMGPIFGGMLMSGKKVAERILSRAGKGSENSKR